MFGRILKLISHPRTLGPTLKSLRTAYSQYGEDQLFRLIMQPATHGTYVDVGSHHPIDGSNTYYLYARGWRGLTIDPNPEFAKLYRELRPGQTHLAEGVALAESEITNFQFDDSVFNTFSEDRAREVEGFAKPIIKRHAVRCRPLAEIVEEHLDGKQIDLLSVDCEGFDEIVIQSLDLAHCRPTVILIEDYQRLVDIRDGSSTSAIHAMLVEHSYHQVAQLAFSAMYVAKEWRDLIALSSAYDKSRIQGGILP